MSIGNRLRETRIRRNMTIGALAEASKLSKGFISQVENGASSPSLSSLQRIAASLGMPLSQLLGEPSAQLSPAPRGHSKPRVVRGNQLESYHPSVEVVSDRPTGKLLTVLLSMGVELRGPADAMLPELEEGFCCVLKGGTVFRQDEHELDLYAGDTLSWNPNRGYAFQARRSPCKLLLCLPIGCDLPALIQPPVPDRRKPTGVQLAPVGPFRLVEMRAQRGTARRR